MVIFLNILVQWASAHINLGRLLQPDVQLFRLQVSFACEVGFYLLKPCATEGCL